MADSIRGFNLPAPVVALTGWFVPGAGYWLIGERARAVIVFVAIVALYLLGLLIAGVRVIDVPGYGRFGYKVQMIGAPVRGGGVEYRLIDPRSAEEAESPALRNNEFLAGWALRHRLFGEIANKPWFAGQVLVGPLSLVSAAGSNLAARNNIPRPHAPLETVGTLYTAIAGMLNLYIIIDSAHRAGQRPEAE